MTFDHFTTFWNSQTDLDFWSCIFFNLLKPKWEITLLQNDCHFWWIPWFFIEICFIKNAFRNETMRSERSKGPSDPKNFDKKKGPFLKNGHQKDLAKNWTLEFYLNQFAWKVTFFYARSKLEVFVVQSWFSQIDRFFIFQLPEIFSFWNDWETSN